MIGRRTKARPPLSYTAISPTARLDPTLKNSFNFARDVTDIYAHTSVSGLKKRSRSQPADQQGILMGDINVVTPIGTPLLALPNPLVPNINPPMSLNFQEKIGGPRAAVALTSKARLASTLNDNQVHVQGLITPVNTLTQSGVTTTINVAQFSLSAGDITVSYNSGSVNPGAFGTFVVYAFDQDFKGGAVTYLAATSQIVPQSRLGFIFIGTITTIGGGGGTGGGGGSSGGRKIL